MKKLILHPSAFILALVLGLGSCASPRVVTLPDGKTLPAAPTYVSASEMADRGKNSYGVPETSFAFYPDGWVPEKKNEAGRTKEEQIAYSKAILASRGRKVDYIPYCPGGTPSWDLSCGDLPSIRHDCFSVERLFVVPWGSGEGEVGRKLGSPLTWLPQGIGEIAPGVFAVEDSATNRTVYFDLAGMPLKAPEQSLQFWDNTLSEATQKIYAGFKGDYPSDRPSFRSRDGRIWNVQFGPCSQYLPCLPMSITEYSTAQAEVLCRVYFPVEYEASGMEITLDGSLSEIDQYQAKGKLLQFSFNGDEMILAKVTRSGFEVYRYAAR